MANTMQAVEGDRQVGAGYAPGKELKRPKDTELDKCHLTTIRIPRTTARFLKHRIPIHNVSGKI